MKLSERRFNIVDLSYGLLIFAIIAAVLGLVLILPLLFIKVENKQDIEVAIRGLLPEDDGGKWGYKDCDELASAVAKGECELDECVIIDSELAEEIDVELNSEDETE